MIILTELKSFVEDLTLKLEFPSDAQKDVLAAMDTVIANNTASSWFISLLQQYEENENCDYTQILAHIKSMSEAVQVHEYTLTMLLLLCMAKKLKERYVEKGIDLDVWLHTLRDLRYKLYECRSIHSVNGTFVGWWYPGFYKLTRFALGRLQFEITYSGKEYTIGNTTIPEGSMQINMHIPNTGTKLDHDEVLNAYRLAAEWFGPQFESKPIVFHCTSWLLSPWHIEILPETANMVQFIKDFKMVESGKYDSYRSLWLLFGRNCENGTADLPKDTFLRRAYAQCMDNGEPTYWGKGMFIYKDGKIIND